MILDRDFVLKALLQHNYFPVQKKDREEMPPIFTSITFTPDAARKLLCIKPRKKQPGFDVVEYKATRYNGVSRCFSIPHPAAHAQLCFCIYDNWDKLEYIAQNRNSLIRPRLHADGRIMMMDYDNWQEKARRIARMGFGRRFQVHSDISNCFPSIYSHAIAWAVIGFDQAKELKSDKTMWCNKLDTKLILTKRNETQGVAIGPATSNVVSEAILARVDFELVNGGFKFVRYIDDYTAYCKTETEAQEFILRLSEELSKYKLLLSINKTKILPLPQPASEDWLTRLSLLGNKGNPLNTYEAVSYLNLAVSLASESPDGSVLKYATKTLLGRGLESKAYYSVLPILLSLSFHHPILISQLSTLFEATQGPGSFRYGDELCELVKTNSIFRRSDGMCWALHFMNKYQISVTDDIVVEVMKSKDCLAMLLLYKSGQNMCREAVVDYAKNLSVSDLYGLDQQWLLLYQLFMDGLIANPYINEDTFNILRDSGVSFVS